MLSEAQTQELDVANLLDRLPLRVEQRDAANKIVRITGLTRAGSDIIANALANHSDVPGTNYSRLWSLVEEPEVVLLASFEEGHLAGVSIGCLGQWAPCNDPLVRQGFALGFIADHLVDTVQGLAVRQRPLVGNILAVLVDSFQSSGQASSKRGIGGAHIAAHLAIQAKSGNEKVLGFCPSEGTPENTQVYQKLLRNFGFRRVGLALFGSYDKEKFRRMRDDLLAMAGKDPQRREQADAYALCQVVGLVESKKVFHAMESDLKKFGLLPAEFVVVKGGQNTGAPAPAKA